MTAQTSLSMGTLYDRDYVLWTEKTAEQLRQKNFAEVDWENLIEEIESMGRSERQAVVSLLTVLIEHLLKLAYWESERERNARHWIVEIATFRSRLDQKIETTTLANHARDSFEKAYLVARKTMIDARIVAKDSIPVEPFFSVAGGAPLASEQALDADWFPIEIDRFLENR
ncbi:DUF29 domain-containing protein [Pannus brasiliensis CCIBt3594]|uniref:DUF29 domain-containing protein n=1 Tax=Pannus brasiliensis CCIBt3594 TaxID=1427578 RepID=A0AAW9QTC1_9CHRO